MDIALTPQILLRAYMAGVFPMADSASSKEIGWFNPPQRGILPLAQFHVPKSLRRFLKSQRFAVTVNQRFSGVVDGCAEKTAQRPKTWINPEIKALYHALHLQGHAHSIEVWRDASLVGGIYGVAIGSAFFGESMFSREANASRVALVHLAARLWTRDYQLFDTQYVNPHLLQFGAIEISRAEYLVKLHDAIQQPRCFHKHSENSLDQLSALTGFLQSRSQTS